MNSNVYKQQFEGGLQTGIQMEPKHVF